MTRADSDPVARECERHIERLEVQIARALDGSVTVATLLDLRRDPHCLVDQGLMTRARELHRQLLKEKVTVFSDRDGTVQMSTPLQFVAWHAGQSAWPVPASGVPEQASVNRRSIGIEFANLDDGVERITAAQITSAVALAKELGARYPALARTTSHVRHRDISPVRKTDPHPIALDWPAFLALIAKGFL